MRMRSLCLGVLVFGALTRVSGAADVDSRALSARLAELLGTQQLFEAMLTECRSQAAALRADRLYEQNPQMFGGLSPKSAYWPRVEQTIRKYQGGLCDYLTAEEFQEQFVASYSEALSGEDLKDAVAFYSSPAGKRIVAANASANQKFQKMAQNKLAGMYESATAEMNAGLIAIVQEYQRDPR